MSPSVEVEVEAILEVGAATETGRYCKVRVPPALVFARCGQAAIGSDTLLVQPSLPMRTRSLRGTLERCPDDLAPRSPAAVLSPSESI